MQTPNKRKSTPSGNKIHKVDVSAQRRRKELLKVQKKRARARKLKPIWTQIEKPITEMQLLDSLVTSRSKIACIGPMGSPFRDPSAAYLAKIVRSKNVTVVDAQDNNLKKELLLAMPGKSEKSKSHILKKVGGLTGIERKGQGALRAYRKISTMPVESGERLSKTVSLVPGKAWNTRIKPNSLDLVIDRGTWTWIASQGEHRLPETIQHYLDIIKPGANIVFFITTQATTRTSFRTPESYKEQLYKILQDTQSQGKVHVREFPMKNIFTQYELGSKQGWKVFPAYQSEVALVVTKLK